MLYPAVNLFGFPEIIFGMGMKLKEEGSNEKLEKVT
jgi:hypothetical protein